uniref:Retrotransposon Copia-like N-terminal domain-containing protein n=1 Tax=Fagus sylvatica TaxID=28930 RepID=A0A2N9FND0_FAGSY
MILLSNISNLVSIKLDHSNYVLWKYHITSILKAYAVLGFVDGTQPCPPQFLPNSEGILQENPLYLPWISRDRSRPTDLDQLYFSPTAFSLVVGQTTAHGVWSILEKRYTSASRSNILNLKMELHNIKKEATDTVNSFLQKILQNSSRKLKALLSYFEFHLQAPMASEISHTPSKSSASTVSVIDDHLPSSPYYLHASDNSSLILVTEPLTGDNFHSWFRSMNMALTIKNKLGFVDGSIRELEDGFRCSLIRQEERQRSIGSLNGSLNSPFVESTALLCKSEGPKYGANKQSIGHKKERPMCTHCGLLGHTMDKCYKLHGFPPGYKTRGKAPAVQAQCKQLLALINSKNLTNTVPNITNSHHQPTANTASSSTFPMTGLHPLEDDWTG